MVFPPNFTVITPAWKSEMIQKSLRRAFVLGDHGGARSAAAFSAAEFRSSQTHCTTNSGLPGHEAL